MKDAKKSKKPRGRPPVLVIPDPIPDTPENIARARHVRFAPPGATRRH